MSDPADPGDAQTIPEKILNFARWAPSGDNTQPWRFEIPNNAHIVIHGRDTRAHCVYDLEGRASQTSLGALIETLSIGATTCGIRAEITRRDGCPDINPIFDAILHKDSNVRPDPLAPFIPERVTQRRALSRRPVPDWLRRELETAAGPGYRVLWLENRKRVAWLLFQNAGLRLTLPEAYPTHRDIIEWGAQFSEDRIPDKAIGLDPLTLKLMKWVMKSWERVRFFNRYLAGSIMPRLQMDLIPGLRCGAHFVLVAKQPPKTLDDYVAAGRALQRFWLTTTRFDVRFQPELTPLIFAAYVRGGIRFSETPAMIARARKLERRLNNLVGAENAPNAVFMGRVGYGPVPDARSTRRALSQLTAVSRQGANA